MHKVFFTSWHEGVSWHTEILSQVFHHEYYDSNGLTVSHHLTTEEGKLWSQSLPKKILSEIIKFESKYQDLSLSCLWFISRSEYAEDLFLNSPILTWLVVKYAVDQKLSDNQALTLFSLKRKDILRLYGLPNENRLINFLKKVDDSAMLVKHWDLIKDIVQSNGYEKLISFKTVNDRIFLIIQAAPYVLEYPFFRRLLPNDNLKQVMLMTGDIRFIGEIVDRDNYQNKLERCKNLVQLENIHNHYLKEDWESVIKAREDEASALRREQMSRIEDARRENAKLLKDRESGYQPFPQPPIPESENIKYIGNRFDLASEGKEMDHCIESYLTRIAKGKYYVYKILEPERATIGLRFKGKKLVLDEVKKSQNGTPAKYTFKAIYDWLESSKYS